MKLRADYILEMLVTHNSKIWAFLTVIKNLKYRRIKLSSS
jgi:hypothetical protein